MPEPISGEIRVQILGLEEGETTARPPRPPQLPGIEAAPANWGLTPGGLTFPLPSGSVPPVTKEQEADPKTTKAPTPLTGAFLPSDFQPLTKYQEEELKAAKEAIEMQKKVGEYQEKVLGVQAGKQTGLLQESAGALKHLIGPLSIGALVLQSKLLQASMSAILEMLGALVDVVFAPLAPVFGKILEFIASIVGWLQKFIADPEATIREMAGKLTEAIGDAVRQIPAMFGTIPEDIGKGLSAIWENLKTVGVAAWTTIVDFATQRWGQLVYEMKSRLGFLLGEPTEEEKKRFGGVEYWPPTLSPEEKRQYETGEVVGHPSPYYELGHAVSTGVRDFLKASWVGSLLWAAIEGTAQGLYQMFPSQPTMAAAGSSTNNITNNIYVTGSVDARTIEELLTKQRQESEQALRALDKERWGHPG